MPRRIKLLFLEDKFLAGIITRQTEILNLPDGVKVLKIMYAHDRQAMAIILEHDSFELITPGGKIPEFMAEMLLQEPVF